MAWRSESRVVSRGRVSSRGLSAGPHLNSAWPMQMQFSQYNLSVMCVHTFSILGNTRVLLDCCLLFTVLSPSGPLSGSVGNAALSLRLNFLLFRQFSAPALDSKKTPSFHFPAH